MVTRVVKVRGAVESMGEKGWKDQRMEGMEMRRRKKKEPKGGRGQKER